MKHSIFRPASVYHPPLPFPMPEPQRGRAMSILIAEARAAKVPPAMLVTHLPDSEKAKFTAVRVRVIQRIFGEVEGVSIKMIARAFRRDHRRIKELLEKNTKSADGGSERKDHE